MNANLEAIKQEIIAGADALNSSKEVYEFKKKYLDGKAGKIYIYFDNVLVKEAGAIEAASCAILAEGDAADRDDIIFLEKLPLFFK